MIAQAYCFGAGGPAPQRHFAAMALAAWLLLALPVASARAADPIALSRPARRPVEGDRPKQGSLCAGNTTRPPEGSD
jgi:hypothetical protein